MIKIIKRKKNIVFFQNSFIVRFTYLTYKYRTPKTFLKSRKTKSIIKIKNKKYIYKILIIPQSMFWILHQTWHNFELFFFNLGLFFLSSVINYLLVSKWDCFHVKIISIIFFTRIVNIFTYKIKKLFLKNILKLLKLIKKNMNFIPCFIYNLITLKVIS